MAIIDAYNKFCDKLAVFAAAGTNVRGDLIDLATARDIGNGEPLYWNVVVTTAFAGGTSAEFQLCSDAQDPIATDATASLHSTTGAVAVAGLPAGKAFSIALPMEGRAYERYLGLRVVTVGTVTQGSITSFLSKDPYPGWKAYAEGTD